MVMLIAASDEASSSTTSLFTYDVFLSFRGADTRKNFTDHLYAGLWRAGVRTFRDDDAIERGKCLKPELEKAIKQSAISVIIFSQNFASSRWCLDELLTILEHKRSSKHEVIPVFYKVDPSDVREQNRSYAEAFCKHCNEVNSEMNQEGMERVRAWRAALTEAADLTGLVLADAHESNFILKIIDEIESKLYLQPEQRQAKMSVSRRESEFINKVVDETVKKLYFLPNQTLPRILPPATGEGSTSSALVLEKACRYFSLSDIKSATQNFDEALVVGRGGFGKVYKGFIGYGPYGLATVAIKRLGTTSRQGAVEFKAELRILSKLRHANLVSLIGYCNDAREMMLVYEYMAKGSLRDHLHNNVGTPLSWSQRLKICIDTARGLNYLHNGTSTQQHGLIHRDVKSSNILLDENFAAKISDFGLAKIMTTQARDHETTVVQGTIGYLDPSYVLTGRLTRKSDVYSFGVVLFEMLCGRDAVDNSSEGEMIGLGNWVQKCIENGKLSQIIDSRITGQISTYSLKEFILIVVSCLHADPNQRPTMAMVLAKLEYILSLQGRTDLSSVDETYTEKKGKVKPEKLSLWHRFKQLIKFSSNESRTLSFPGESLEKSSTSTQVTWTSDQEQTQCDLVEIIINWELPFNFVEDPIVRKWIHGMYPNFNFFSQTTIRSDCMKRYELERSVLHEKFQSAKPRVCLTTDIWTSSTQELRYMAITAHFINDEWKLEKKIINFVLVPVKATGENLANVVLNCLLDWKIEKICTTTMDSETSNDGVARALSGHYSSRGSLLLHGRHVQVHCWAHVLNLCVQEGLEEIKDSISRIREGVKYISQSPSRKLEFLQHAEQESIAHGKELVLDVSTRWDSTYQMLGSALHYKRVYKRMRSLDSEDWEKVEILHHFLDTFYLVMKTLSGRNSTANLSSFEIFRILILLKETSIDSGSLLGRIASNMLLKFEKYWSGKEQSILLPIAIVLDPRYKLKILKFCYTRTYDSPEVENLMHRVEEVLQDLFEEYSSAYEEECGKTDESCNVIKASFRGQPLKKMDLKEEFYKFNEEENKPGSKTELYMYLDEKLHKDKSVSEEEFNVLDWWKYNARKFPVLSRIARDILAIPVSSVPSESAFCTGGRVLSKFWSSLPPSTVEALICTQDWIQDYLVENDFAEA